jgi:hypothetical protein
VPVTVEWLVDKVVEKVVTKEVPIEKIVRVEVKFQWFKMTD